MYSLGQFPLSPPPFFFYLYEQIGKETSFQLAVKTLLLRHYLVEERNFMKSMSLIFERRHSDVLVRNVVVMWL